MARKALDGRSLPANTKSIAKAARSNTSTVREFRIEGARGLVLHVLPSGTATWHFHYDLEAGSGRKRRKLKLGRLDDLVLAQAVDAAGRLRSLIRQGVDPVLEKKALRQATTFAELTSERFAKGEALRPGTRRDYEHVLAKDILPFIGEKPAKSVSRNDVIQILDRISLRGANRRADTARAVISSIFGFALDRGLVAVNPASGLRNRHDYQPRDVVLGDDAIRVLWAALTNGEAAMSAPIAAITKFALLTGLRRTEIAAARKSEIDLNELQPAFTVPRGRAKNRNAHRVPLSPQAATLLRNACDAAGDSEFVFPGAGQSLPISSRSASKAMERTRRKLRLCDVRLHDLRRTVGTRMSKLGVPMEVRKLILNHGGSRKGSVTEGVYNHYEYDSEKRAALELWADALDAIVGDGPIEIDGYHLRLAKLKGVERIRVA